MINKWVAKRLPKEAVDLVKQRRREWAENLPVEVKDGLISHWQLAGTRSYLFRAGLPYSHARPRVYAWTYFLPLRGRKNDKLPKAKALRIAEAMSTMPDLICEYREQMRKIRKEERKEAKLERQRERLLHASSQRITDMRSIVDRYDNVDDAWMDADEDYYSLAYSNKSKRKGMDLPMKSNIKGIKVPNDRVRLQARQKLRQLLREKPLLAGELDKYEETPEYEFRKENDDPKNPETATWDDGQNWQSHRSRDEYAFLQQIVNEVPLADPHRKPPSI